MRIPEELQSPIDGGESVTVEFKESHTDITKDVYETVCSFSNREGGHIFLGVKNNGEIIGIREDKVEKIKKQFVTTVNNDSKIYPPLYLTPMRPTAGKSSISAYQSRRMYTKMYSGTNPQFVEGDVFRITIPLAEVATATVGPGPSDSSNGAINRAINGAINGAIKLADSEQRVLEALLQNPRITRKELVVRLGIGDGTVHRAIQKLKAERIIERIGSNKTGYWKINDT